MYDVISLYYQNWEGLHNYRLLTVGFKIWLEKEGLRQSFLKKPMESEILTIERLRSKEAIDEDLSFMADLSWV